MHFNDSSQRLYLLLTCRRKCENDWFFELIAKIQLDFGAARMLSEPRTFGFCQIKLSEPDCAGDSYTYFDVH